MIEQRVAAIKEKSPAVELINLGIGDISLPLAPLIAQAICQAAEEMTSPAGRHGYGPHEGFPFLREAIAEVEYPHLGIEPDEIFISEGINRDIVQIHELFHPHARIAIPDPTYPAYFDTLAMAGKGPRIERLACTATSHYLPEPCQHHFDLIYLCFPNNPTGVGMSRNQLANWVSYAHAHQAVLLCDRAYKAFTTSPDVPLSIYEIEGAAECAIEFCSFSKSAGFTGLRCGYTVVPNALHGRCGRRRVSLRSLWDRRQATQTNGVSYPIQRGALAALSSEGLRQTRAQVATYLQTAKILREGLERLGYTCAGGLDSPYIWWRIDPASSWEFFDRLLEECHLVCVPGRGFGALGEGHVRLSAFTTPDVANRALERIAFSMASLTEMPDR